MQGFSFTVEISQAGSALTGLGYFTEFSGATVEVNAIQYKTYNKETGQPQTYQIPGRVDPGTVTLKHGLTPDLSLLKWAGMITEGKLNDARATVTVTVNNRAYQPTLTITLTNAWPSKFQMGGINVETNNIQVEELTLVYETLRISKFTS
jgi:phage tail-like protein